MDIFDSLDVVQPMLLPHSPVSSHAVELFPTMWAIAENLTSPDVEMRRMALRGIDESGAVRISALVSYLVATRLTDPDLELRSQAVRLLVKVYLPDEEGRLAPESVRRNLDFQLSQMRTRSIFALLEADVEAGPLTDELFQLLKACPFAGNHLADLAADRQTPLSIRKRAVYYIGLVGYLDAAPALERLAGRLEARLNGQQTMSFITKDLSNEVTLLPEVQKTLELLKH